MLDTLYNMFAPSPRSSKRQKLDQEAIQESKSPRGLKRAAKPVNPPLSTTRHSKAGKLATAPQRAIEVDDGTKSDFVDSAYHSMGTSPEKNDDVGGDIATPTKRSGRRNGESGPDTAVTTTQSNRRTKRSDANGLKESLVQKALETNETPTAGEHEKSSNEEDAVVVRTSGRARTKTWKSVESEAKTQRLTAQHKLAQDSDAGLAASPSISGKHKPESKRRSLPVPSESASKAGIKQGKLRMPVKRPQPAATDDVLDQSEDEAFTPPVIEEVNDSVQENEIDNNFSSPRKAKARISVTPKKASRAQTTPDVSSPQSAARATKKISPLSRLLVNEDYRKVMTAMRDSILNYLMANGPLPLYGEDHHIAYGKIYQVLEQTVSAGEGNSMLLIGARGTAKTTLVNIALKELNREFENQFHIVRLNGFIHTDDKLALKETWRQLGREMAIDDGSQVDLVNYADTMASLLALLSQPEELLSSEGNRTTSKSVIFILDEFDLFTTHPRQTLLYNLFDIAQSRKAPIAVLGLTTRIDVVESLEKRVKSRFSHRYTYVSHPQSFSAYTSIIRTFLLASAHDQTMEVPNHFIKSPALHELRVQFSTKFTEVYQEWSNYVEQLFADQSILLMLNRHYSQTKSPQAFLNAFLLPIMKLPSLPEPADLLMHGLSPPDSNLDLLPSLSDASLALLIAAARLDIVCDTDTVTFNMAYDEYVRLAQRSRMSASASGMIAVSGTASGGSKTVLSRDIALAAWEQLEELGLLLPVAGQGGYGQVQGAMVDLGRGGRLVRVDIGLEEIGAAGLELGAMARWCKEI